ncbi:MAG TPA: LppX_LprAFG lipoprotein [Candidatus Nanopelagicales bacterium]|nr:LppX_LprAFG lipoprotein [Candidatus Nanopelagicales bacterium]
MRRTTVAIAAGSLLLLTGCASVSTATMSRGTPRDDVVTAALATEQAGSAHVALDVRTLGSDPMALTIDGRLALDGSKADLTASVPSGGLGSGSGSASVHEIVVDGSTYLQVRGIDLLPAVWVKADLGSGGADTDNPLARLATSAGVDDLLAALREVGTVQKVARQEVGGVPTTKYHATLDASSFLKDLPDLGGLDLGAVTGAAAVPVDLWVDDEGRLVQLQATVGSGDSGVRVTLGLADFGVPVAVTAPAASLDLGSLLDGLGG